MEEQKKNRQVAKISVFITSIFVICISVAYAFINQTLTGTKRQVITAGNLQLELKEKDAITLENTLPMYDEVGMIQRSFDFTLINKTTENTNYTIKLKDVTGEDKQKLDTTLVRYGLTKDGIVTKDFLSNLTDNVIDSGSITGNQTIQYNLRLWIDSSVENEELIKEKTLSYRIEVTTNQKIATIYPEISSELVGKNLGENCTTYDDGIDTFLVGQCSNNYVWYSGKLWRVVLRNNETGAIKMITDGPITAISYSTAGNSDFENSYVDQWLNQEFLPTLHDYEDYLVVDSTWDATLVRSDTPSRPIGTTTVQRTVGLLNAYEYYTSLERYDKSWNFGFGYLSTNALNWDLITPYSASELWGVQTNGGLRQGSSSGSSSIRPSINLQADIRIISGSGRKQDPYILEGDSREIISGTTRLSTRYSGEYITFNNELYRIVGVEGSNTKIIAVDKPTTLSSSKFHGDDSIISFANASIKTDLENYYQNNIIDSYKSMIEPNTTWYLGTVEDGASYKASICKTVNIETSTSTCERTDAIALASIGLPRVGEMFTSLNVRRASEFGTDFWTLTTNDQYILYIVYHGGALGSNKPVTGKGARPSMYLKPNVVISSTNTGDGTYEHPYDIELSE